jgi:hypothetical protein
MEYLTVADAFFSSSNRKMPPSPLGGIFHSRYRHKSEVVVVMELGSISFV